MAVAAAWYESGTFWTIAAVAVAVIIGVATIVATYQVGHPRRNLFYGMPKVTPLLAAPAGLRGDLELRHDGVVLTEPHVVELWLVTRGRRDIPSDNYDQQEPIRLDVGVPILRLLQETVSITPVPNPKVCIDGTLLKIGPGLLRARQKITYTLLVDGPPQLTAHCSLIDVRVRASGNPEQLSRLSPTVVNLTSLGGALLTGAFVAAVDPSAGGVRFIVGFLGIALAMQTFALILLRKG